MKKLVFTALAISAMMSMSFAQTAAVANDTAVAKVALTKEQKNAIKEKTEIERKAAMIAAGITAEQYVAGQQIMTDFNKKSTEIKKSEKTEEEKTADKKVISAKKDEELKTLLGDKAKLFNEIRNKYKEIEKARYGN